MKLTIHREYIKHRSDNSKKVEIFWSEQLNSKKSPLVIIVHGHNEGLRLGARTDIYTGVFEYFSENGAVAVTMSQPGYGNSDGPTDYCGPFTSAALSSVIDFFSKNDSVDSENIIVYGLSRGATVAALAACSDSRIKSIILVAGLYNMYDGYDYLNDGIKKSLSTEASNSEESLKKRSPFYQLHDLKIPTLMIHGDKDEVAHSKFAKEFFEAAKLKNKKTQFKLFEEYGHGIPFELCCDLAGNFLYEEGFWDKPVRPYCLSCF